TETPRVPAASKTARPWPLDHFRPPGPLSSLLGRLSGFSLRRRLSRPTSYGRITDTPAGQTRAGKYVRLKRVGRVAQVVEQRPFKAWVAGSNPAALTNLRPESTGPLCEGLTILSASSPRRYSAPSR